jgi:plasmid stabilization system protein ParE
VTRRIKLETRAAAEIETARNWWLDNRPAVPTAFDEELERAFDAIRSFPHVGQTVDDADDPDQRRLFLPRVRYHLYYRVADDAIEVRALWHASRGSGPET